MAERGDINLPSNVPWDKVDADRDEDKKRRREIEEQNREYEERQRRHEEEERKNTRRLYSRDTREQGR
jgi:hypothetical protein